ncbi:ACP S-malonyltransferase [Roseateles sp. BYS87W]|uniref:ACP S-malonyltransferase n=1 Tax=Pelomonas baiyunensis TaxID=3299026 RepID=A0ABW7GYF6_9BURK
MTLALLFPGQGAQHAAMLPWLEADPAAVHATGALQALAAAVGADWRTQLHTPGWMHTNAVAQPLLTGLSLAAWQAVAPHLPAPAVVAGYSVGELAAYAAAGVMEPAAAVALAAQRAALMSACAQGQAGGLLSVQGPGALARAQAEADLHLAIRISPERVLVGGLTPTLEVAAARWSAEGLRCTRLPIGVASHTPLMAEAAQVFEQTLAQQPLRAPRAAVVTNRHGTASRQLSVLAPALAAQIAHTVRWDDTMDTLAERGVRCVLEVGPGSTLAAMWRERHPAIPVRSVDEFRSAQAAGDWVTQQLQAGS